MELIQNNRDEIRTAGPSRSAIEIGVHSGSRQSLCRRHCLKNLLLRNAPLSLSRPPPIRVLMNPFFVPLNKNNLRNFGIFLTWNEPVSGKVDWPELWERSTTSSAYQVCRLPTSASAPSSTSWGTKFGRVQRNIYEKNCYSFLPSEVIAWQGTLFLAVRTFLKWWKESIFLNWML